MKIYKCSKCEKEFENPKVLANHVKWHHSTEDKLNETKRKISIAKIESNKKLLVKRIKIKRICPQCGKEYDTRKKINTQTNEELLWRKSRKSCYEKYFCSTSCGNSSRKKVVWTDEMKELQSLKVKKLWEDENYVSKTLGSQKTIFRSKREIEIVNYIKRNYPDDGWTFGGLGKFKEVSLNADLYSRKLKIIFEYDGVWHFKDIHGQLADKQMKDRLQEEYSIENGYRLIRIDEDKKLSFNEIEELIYKRNEKIIKIGERY